jgi:hypothetical protein
VEEGRISMRCPGCDGDMVEVTNVNSVGREFICVTKECLFHQSAHVIPEVDECKRFAFEGRVIDWWCEYFSKGNINANIQFEVDSMGKRDADLLLNVSRDKRYRVIVEEIDK